MHVGLNLNLLLMARFLNFMIGPIGPIRKKQVAPAPSAKYRDEDEGGAKGGEHEGTTRGGDDVSTFTTEREVVATPVSPRE